MNAKNATFYYKERKRMQRKQHSFKKNVKERKEPWKKERKTTHFSKVVSYIKLITFLNKQKSCETVP